MCLKIYNYTAGGPEGDTVKVIQSIDFSSSSYFSSNIFEQINSNPKLAFYK